MDRYSQLLHKIQQGIRAIQGDGNCLFHALSTIICNNENSHQHIRRLLVAFSRHNKEHLKAFCHPVPIKEHINGMEKDRVWGTDLEIHAAAALWQVKIYVCVSDSTTSSYSWICFNPMPLSQLTIPIKWQELPCPSGVFISNCYMPGDVTMMSLLVHMDSSQLTLLQSLIYQMFISLCNIIIMIEG